MASMPSTDDSFWRHSSATWYPNMSSQIYSSQPQLPPMVREPDSRPSFSSSSSSARSGRGLIYNSYSSFGVKMEKQDQVCPDGGRDAWLVIVGSAFLLFATFGFQTCLGIFQLHLSLNQLSSYTGTEIAWIPGLFVFSSSVFALIVGGLFDKYGARHILGTASLTYFLTFILLARCTKYWHFILCLGLLGGLSSGTITTVANGVIGHWFKERQGMASALAMAGAALGGITFPLILNPLLENVGWIWGMQALAFIMGGVLVIGNIFSQSRVRAASTSTSTSIKIDFNCFKDSRFVWLTLAAFGFELLIISAIGIGPSYAYSADYGKQTGYFLVMTASIGSTIGRLTVSYFCDTFGRFNTLLVTSFVTLILMLILWMPFGEVHIGALYLWVFLYGFGTGTFVHLSAACLSQICAGKDMRKWLSAMDSVTSVATLVAIPSASALLENVSGKVMVAFLVGVCTVSIFAVAVARSLGLGGQWFVKARI